MQPEYSQIQLCRRQWCRECKSTTKSFDLLKIWAISLKILEKMAPNVCRIAFLGDHINKIASWSLWEKKFLGKSRTKTFWTSLEKIGQKSFAPPKICLFLHLCAQLWKHNMAGRFLGYPTSLAKFKWWFKNVRNQCQVTTRRILHIVYLLCFRHLGTTSGQN